MASIFIVAEAGVNHNGKVELAKRLIDEAKRAGADAIKFQTFKAENLLIADAPKAAYQLASTPGGESQYGMLKRLELDREAHRCLFEYCRETKLEFISSPFDIDSIRFLGAMGLNILKIPSGEITNLPYLREIAAQQKAVILSTGMSDMAEVEQAVRVLLNGGLRKDQLTVLHCNTEYPTPDEDVNLKAMLQIRDRLGVRVGYSDHTLGHEVTVAAAALGAEVIEKHFTLDRSMPGPDHASSMEPDAFRDMVLAVRRIEKALGNGIKRPSRSEIKNIGIVRKSIVARTKIKRGERFTEENLTVKRPGTGLSPMFWDEILGIPASRDYEPDDMIER